MVVVKLTGRDGVVGWGEIWQFSECRVEHRARLVEHVIALILLARDFDPGLSAAFDHLTDPLGAGIADR